VANNDFSIGVESAYAMAIAVIEMVTGLLKLCKYISVYKESGGGKE